MENAINKKLLLAKEFHLNACELAKRTDPLSKMMAVHNFHIGIEITLKTILLKNEIRLEKTLNISFEQLMNDVDKFPDFRDKGLKLPYRQEITNLNKMRGLIQHQAIEPDWNSLDDWRLYSAKFLITVFEKYFDTDFRRLNRISFISPNFSFS